MKVKPKLAYRFANSNESTGLNPNKVYNAIIATNQPEHKEKGKIFIDDMLLERGEYIIIK